MGFIRRLAGVIGKRDLDDDLDDELRSHVEMRTEELLASGMAADEAREIYRRGIQVSTQAGDTHTRSELEAVLDLLG